MLSSWAQNPTAVRVAPFALYLALTFLQGKLGEASLYWGYALKTVLAGALVLAWRKHVPEMRWAFSLPAAFIGLLVLVIWVGLDPYYPAIGRSGPGWNPHRFFGQDSPWAWFFIVLRILGSGLIVPMLEEVFYRSFMTRYWSSADFTSVPLSQRDYRGAAITAVAFGFAHSEWLAGILCGVCYQWLVWRRGQLGEAMTAHAITNILLGIWIAWQGAWIFW
ncbi:MAG: CAAX prenyl protease-related protein [Verrucomicrobia bacterium]|nr:CAAX prenyl protease-related protein [Verrucomicrobiota bacterium]